MLPGYDFTHYSAAQPHNTHQGMVQIPCGCQMKQKPSPHFVTTGVTKYIALANKCLCTSPVKRSDLAQNINKTTSRDTTAKATVKTKNKRSLIDIKAAYEHCNGTLPTRTTRTLCLFLTRTHKFTAKILQQVYLDTQQQYAHTDKP